MPASSLAAWIAKIETGAKAVRYDSGQCGTFDSRDNRRDLLRMFQRIGRGESEERAAAMRAIALEKILTGASCPVVREGAAVRPVSPMEAYAVFVGITGTLGRPIEQAAVDLEEIARHA